MGQRLKRIRSTVLPYSSGQVPISIPKTVKAFQNFQDPMKVKQMPCPVYYCYIVQRRDLRPTHWIVKAKKTGTFEEDQMDKALLGFLIIFGVIHFLLIVIPVIKTLKANITTTSKLTWCGLLIFLPKIASNRYSIT